MNEGGQKKLFDIVYFLVLLVEWCGYYGMLRCFGDEELSYCE